MTTPITKEPLYAEVHNVPDDYHFTDAELERIMAGDMFTPRQGAIMARELQERRKAAMDAEPVADVVAWHKEGEERTCDIRWRRFDVEPGPLFAVAQPVLVVPDEMAISDDMNLYQKSFAQGHNACRSAMLDHSENERDMVELVSQPYKLPPNSFTNDDLEMMAHGDNPQANAYRELLAFRRNSPVIPDGWQLVPIDATEKMLIAGLEEANPLGGLIDWDASRGDCNTREQVRDIFKAMLAAAPQQED